VSCIEIVVSLQIRWKSLLFDKYARHNVSSSSDGLVARLAVPDTGSVALNGDLSAECACVAGVLGDFDLLDLLAERGTVTICPLSDSMSKIILMATVSSSPSVLSIHILHV
jgi:hypothetical protein